MFPTSQDAGGHYSNDESITVYKLGHVFPNYNVLIGNFDHYCSNLIVSDD